MDSFEQSRDAAARLARHKVRVSHDTGMGYRELECVLFLLEEGSLEVSDLPEYGINLDLYR